MGNSTMIRRRIALVASAATIAVLTASSMAGAHQGDDATDVMHLCVRNSDGAVRLISPTGPNCRGGERAVHLALPGGGDDEALVEFTADLLDADHPDDLVHWNNIGGVPEGLVAAAAGWLADGQVNWPDIQNLPTWLADGQVSLGDLSDLPDWLADGAISYSELGGSLPDGSVTSSTVEDGSLRAADLAGEYGSDGSETTVGAVTGEKIADGGIEGRDLAAGAVGPDQLTPVTASSTDGPNGTLSGGVLVPAIAADVTASVPSAAMVTGQVQLALSCAACATSVVQYQLERDGIAVSPVYSVELSTTHRFDVATVSVIDPVPTGTSGYRLRLFSDPADFSASNPVLSVQLLGAR